MQSDVFFVLPSRKSYEIAKRGQLKLFSMWRSAILKKNFLSCQLILWDSGAD